MKKTTKKERKKEKKIDLIIKIILIIIIIILLLHNCIIQSNKGKNKTPTGNVDIFEINCQNNPCKLGDILSITDNYGYWDNKQKLRIFENPAFNYDTMFAPESSNGYQFVVKNKTNYIVKYQMRFVEENNNHINMKYKLKKNNKYIKEDYSNYNELNQENIILEPNTQENYYLDWKWISNYNDTEIGHDIQSYYKLSIEVEVEIINE